MDRTHKEQSVLVKEIEDAKSKVTIGADYRHYKSADMIYKVIGLGFLESDQELHIIYQAQYGERMTFLRPLSIWLEQVECKARPSPVSPKSRNHFAYAKTCILQNYNKRTHYWTCTINSGVDTKYNGNYSIITTTKMAECRARCVLRAL